MFIQRLLARLTAPPPHPQLAPLTGPELARQRLTDAAGALLGKGATQAEAFRLLRLELNRLEQGGLASQPPDPPPPPAPVPVSTWALGELRSFATRLLRAA